MDLWYEELEIGYSVSSEHRLVSKAEIVDFATKWDPQPFHLSEELAKDTVFGRLVGSGAHTYAVMIRLGVDCRVLTGKAVAGLGVDQLRYHAPVLPDSFLRARFTVKSMRESSTKPGFGIVGWLAEIFDQRETRVLSAVITNLYRRCPGYEAA